MNPITHLGREDLEALLGQYDLGALVDYRRAVLGIENTNYFVRTRRQGTDAEWVVTVQEQPSYSGGLLVPLLRRCQDAGLPVAPVVATKDGRAHVGLNGKAVLLTPMLPGAHPDTPTKGQVKALGKAIAELHEAAAGLLLRATPPYPRDAAWLQRQAAAVHPHLTSADAQLLDACLQPALQVLRQAETAALPWGLIHGDLFRDNVLFDGEALTGLLDFHHAAAGYLVYDLAVAANDWCNHADKRLHGAHVKALLGAYSEVRRLTAAELSAFPAFMCCAALAFWLSRLAAAIQARQGRPVRVKDPDEFRRICADRLARTANLPSAAGTPQSAHR